MDTQSNNTVISQTVSAPKRQMDAVEVTAADYNGESWDSSPFSAIPQWLLDAHASGNIIPVTPASTDYAEWLIKSPDGEKYISPGDTLYEDLRVLLI